MLSESFTKKFLKLALLTVYTSWATRRQVRYQLCQAARTADCKSITFTVLSALEGIPKGFFYLTGKLIILHFNFLRNSQLKL